MACPRGLETELRRRAPDQRRLTGSRPLLDTDILLGYLALGVAALMLVVVSAAEAGIIAISRSRARAHQSGAGRAPADATSSSATACCARFRSLRLAPSSPVRQHSAHRSERANLDRGECRARRAGYDARAVLPQAVRARIAMMSPEAHRLVLGPAVRFLNAVLAPVAWLATLPVTLLFRLAGRELTPPRRIRSRSWSRSSRARPTARTTRLPSSGG